MPDETNSRRITFIYIYILDILTPAVFPSPLLGIFS
jgi:hypothetical protein